MGLFPDQGGDSPAFKPVASAIALLVVLTCGFLAFYDTEVFKMLVNWAVAWLGAIWGVLEELWK